MDVLNNFYPDEIVDVQIRGVRVCRQHNNGGISITAVGGPGDTYEWRLPAQAEITRVAPKEWPPQPGDLWRDTRRAVWLAADVHDNAETDVVEIAMVCQWEAYEMAPDALIQQYGPLALVHRETGEATS